ncbi:S24 family peptidase, partial [Streptomyces sp. NPDC002088]|uniref:LexA family protein n=1 Tax=Streptomyces sp. NPDC002088 TaxID=3154665 RepID=UPI00331A8B75
MIEAAICDGDWVTVRRQPVAENGDIVAAMLDGKATVKRFKREDGHVWLLPHNAAYEPFTTRVPWSASLVSYGA